MRLNTIPVLVAILVLAAVSPATAQQDPTGTWTSETSGATFQYGGSCTDGTYLYTVGGISDGSAPDAYRQLRRYNPENNQWETLAMMPNTGSYTGAYYNAGAYSNGRVFSFGGYGFYFTNGYWSGTPTNRIYAYTISTGTWAELSATLTSARYILAAAATPTALGDRIYIAGGATTNANDELNPSNDTVNARAVMPGTAYYHSMTAVPSLQKVYVISGYLAGAQSAANYEYTTPTANNANGTWATRAPIQNSSGQPQPRYMARSFSVNDRVYVTGGANNNQTWEYNPATDQWAQRASMNANSRYMHAAAGPIGGNGYVYGGVGATTSGEQYAPPDFGSAPNPPTNLAQTGSRAESSLQALADATQFAGWTNNQIAFSANVTDPNANQQVRFRVQVKRSNVSGWTSPTNLNTGLTAQGTLTINYTIPANDGYDWRWRVEDAYLNSYPPALDSVPEGWIEAFGTLESPNTTSPDFRSDQIPPSTPIPQYPTNTDIQMPEAAGGNVTLFWEEATDNGPVAGISYEIQVAKEGSFSDIEAQLFSTAGNDQYPVFLSVDRNFKYWRLRARDVGGNFSEWSDPLTFRVTFNDGANHSKGDAKRVCGMGAEAAGPGATAALLGLAILALSSGRRIFRN